MKIAIASDHVGCDLRSYIADHLREKGYEILDLGPEPGERADYPVYGEKVARAIVDGACQLGVLICGTGIGISMAANKVPGIRAAVCSEPYSARMARMHNDANIIAFGARVVGSEMARMIVDEFMAAQYEGGRHAARVALLTQLEEKYAKK